MKLFSLFSVILLFALYTTSVMCTNIDDKLIQQILNDPQLSDLLHDPDKLMSMLKEKLRRRPTKSSDKCSVAVSKRNAIIRTGESRAAGAVFLSALTVDSSQACVNACCANASCNTAIMKQKVFLFFFAVMDCVLSCDTAYSIMFVLAYVPVFLRCSHILCSLFASSCSRKLPVSGKVSSACLWLSFHCNFGQFFLFNYFFT